MEDCKGKMNPYCKSRLWTVGHIMYFMALFGIWVASPVSLLFGDSENSVGITLTVCTGVIVNSLLLPFYIYLYTKVIDKFKGYMVNREEKKVKKRLV